MVHLFGPGHTDVQLARTHLAHSLLGLGRYAAAESLFMAARAARRALSGPDDGAVASPLTDLGTLALQRGELPAPEAYFADPAAIFDRAGAKPFAITARVRLVRVLFVRDSVGEATRTPRAVLDALRTGPPVRNAKVVIALRAAGDAAMSRGAAGTADSPGAAATARALGGSP